MRSWEAYNTLGKPPIDHSTRSLEKIDCLLVRYLHIDCRNCARAIVSLARYYQALGLLIPGEIPHTILAQYLHTELVIH